MSSPIIGFQSATPLEAPAYWWLKIQGTAQSEAVALALAGAMQRGLINSGTPEPQIRPDTGQLYWRVKVNIPNVGDRFAETGDFIVIGTNGSGEMCSFELLSGPESQNVENRKFWQQYEVEGGS